MMRSGITVYAIPVIGSFTRMPSAVTTRIPIRIAPLTFLITRIAVRKIPKNASKAPGLAKSPSVSSVSGEDVTIPACMSPVKAIKNPIPEPTECLMQSGMASTIFCCTLNMLNSINVIPDIATQAKAFCHGSPSVLHT